MNIIPYYFRRLAYSTCRVKVPCCRPCLRFRLRNFYRFGVRCHRCNFRTHRLHRFRRNLHPRRRRRPPRPHCCEHLRRRRLRCEQLRRRRFRCKQKFRYPPPVFHPPACSLCSTAPSPALDNSAPHLNSPGRVRGRRSFRCERRRLRREHTQWHVQGRVLN